VCKIDSKATAGLVTRYITRSILCHHFDLIITSKYRDLREI